MEIKKITSIKELKSFTNFEWCNFCRNNSGSESVLEKFSIFFGENGSGKSTICSIIKDLSQNQNFGVNYPKKAEILVKNDSNITDCYTYENGSWNKSCLDKNSILFFDVDFINENVHTHGSRESANQRGGHTQHAGQLIIDLDAKANQLKKIVKLRLKYKDIFNLKNSHKGLSISDDDKKIYKQLGGIKKSERTISKFEKIIEKLSKKLNSLNILEKQHSSIIGIQELEKTTIQTTVSLKSVYDEIAVRELKQKVDNSVDSLIKDHFEKHKQFIEFSVKQIPEKYDKENCPLCTQPLSNVKNVIEFYKNAFDKSYESEKNAMIDDINNLINEIKIIKQNADSLIKFTSDLYNKLEELKKNFEIEGLYDFKEKESVVSGVEKYLSVSIDIDNMILDLENLKGIEKKQNNIPTLYSTLLEYAEKINKSVNRVNGIIESKNELIRQFKNRYSDKSKISKEAESVKAKLDKYNNIVLFLRSKKNSYIYNQEICKEREGFLTEKLKVAEKDLEQHLSVKIPANVTSSMIEILEKFNLNFSIEHITNSSNTKDYAFSFRIKDKRGKERSFKNNLSEGERQLISLAFFFAVNKPLDEKEKKVLVFDDPITSLDSPNLKILSDLIYEVSKDFSQVIILTHHPLFFKYLSKCANACKFGIVKNNELFGGSFVFYDPGFDLIAEVQKCNEDIKNQAQAGNLKMEEISLKYGQLLRLAVEKFIKHELLMWDKEKNFEENIIDNLKTSQNKMLKLNDNDYDVISKIYKYCNYSNLLHADKENPSALSELMQYIDTFVGILNKTRV